jgi:hypothetical protein
VPAALTSTGVQPAEPAADAPRDPPQDAQAAQIAAAQSLYRAGPGLPGLTQWLAEQPREPRAALTIVAEHTPGNAEPAWTRAREMAASGVAIAEAWAAGVSCWAICWG